MSGTNDNGTLAMVIVWSAHHPAEGVHHLQHRAQHPHLRGGYAFGDRQDVAGDGDVAGQWQYLQAQIASIHKSSVT